MPVKKLLPKAERESADFVSTACKKDFVSVRDFFTDLWNRVWISSVFVIDGSAG